METSAETGVRVIRKKLKTIESASRRKTAALVAALVGLAPATLVLSYVASDVWPANSVLWSLAPAVLTYGIILPAVLLDLTTNTNGWRHTLKSEEKAFGGYVKGASKSKGQVEKRKSVHDRILRTAAKVATPGRLASMWLMNFALLATAFVLVGWVHGHVHIGLPVALGMPSVVFALLAIGTRRWLV